MEYKQIDGAKRQKNDLKKQVVYFLSVFFKQHICRKTNSCCIRIIKRIVVRIDKLCIICHIDNYLLNIIHYNSRL